MNTNNKTVYGQWTRLLEIDNCFINNKYPLTIEKIKDRCNENLCRDYSARTYYNDLKIMKEIFNAPIENVKHQMNSCYRYSEYFSLRELPLSSNEKADYEEVLKQLIRFCAFSKDTSSSAVLFRLGRLLGFNEEQGEVMGYDTIRDDKSGQEHINSLFEHIVHKETIDLEYKAMNRDVKKMTVFPYYLKQFNRRWFLIAKKASDGPNGKLMNYALDRIQNFEINNQVKFEESGIVFSKYFEDLYGVTIPENSKIEKVIILMDKGQYPYLESNPLAPSQDLIDEDEEHVTFSLDVYINYELKQKLLSYGSKLKVLEPMSLRDWMANETKKMVETYVHKSE